MTKETITSKLDKFGYAYIDYGQMLTVKLGYALRVTIDLSDPDKIRLKDHLASWNFLTGILEMRLSRALLYNWMGSIVIALLFIWLWLSFNFSGTLLIIIFMALMGWIVLWAIFYLIRAENFKREVRGWAGG